MKKKLLHRSHERNESMIEKDINDIIKYSATKENDLIEFSLAMYTPTEKVSKFNEEVFVRKGKSSMNSNLLSTLDEFPTKKDNDMDNYFKIKTNKSSLFNRRPSAKKERSLVMRRESVNKYFSKELERIFNPIHSPRISPGIKMKKNFERVDINTSNQKFYTKGTKLSEKIEIEKSKMTTSNKFSQKKGFPSRQINLKKNTISPSRTDRKLSQKTRLKAE